MKNGEIIAYITESREHVITGNPLCLCIANEDARMQLASELGRALHANVIQLKNGDFMVIADAR